MRMIIVQGNGQVFAQPDIVIISLNIREKVKDYSECVDNLRKRTSILRTEIESIGIGRSELKTSGFVIEISTREESGRDVFDGYEGSHNLLITIPSERDFLNKALGQIARGNSGAEIRLSFTVADKKSLREEALRSAVMAAKSNAKLLAETATIKLGPIHQIDYGSGRSRMYDTEASMVMDSRDPLDQYEPNIEPAEITAEDMVTITYQIEE